VIFAHGFKGFKDWGHFPIILHEIAHAGFAVLKFNFSFNGGTVNQPIDFPDLNAFAENTYLKELEDMQSILNWCTKDQSKPMHFWDQERIYLIGHSRGGSMALLQAAKDSRIKKVVSWAAVSDLKSRLPDQQILQKWKREGIRCVPNARTKQSMPMNYQFVESFLEHEQALNIQVAVKKISIPQLIIHGMNDESVPVEMAIALKDWNPKARLVQIEDAGHTFGGKHPWHKKKLPKASKQLITETIRFLEEN
jgi:dipeptidyl aminopeptidase/acylaminoacyl peptidase